jgi:hypothetical protein
VSIIDSDLAEHLARARFFLEQSRLQSDAEKRSRFIMASVYPARAVIEVVIDHLKQGMIKGDFREFLSEAAETVRYFKVIEYLRDHDFHRRALQFVPGRQAMYGPIQLSTGNSPSGGAAFSGTGLGGRMEESTTKSGYVRQDRPLQIRDFEIDVEEEGWVPIDLVLDTYLGEVETFIGPFVRRQATS